MEMSDDILDAELYPVWRAALIKFKDARFIHDDIVPHEWFYQAFDIAMPKEDTPLKVAEKAKLAWLSQFDRFKRALLEQYQIKLRTEPGLGYRVVHPREQSKLALEDGAAAIKKAVRDMVDTSTHVNTAMLSAEERRQHTDNLARIGAFSNMFRRARTLPDLDQE
jgi:hypothetical protein